MRPSDRLTLAVTVAVLLATLTLNPLTTDPAFVTLGWLLVLALGVVTAVLRRLRVGSLGVVALQVLIVAGSSLALAASIPARGQPLLSHYAGLWARGIAHMQTQAAPMVPDVGVTVIFVTAVGGIAVLTDLLVSGLHRPMWGIAPPATLFLVPAIGLGADTGLFSFGCIALGYLGILVAEGLNTAARWTRGLSSDSAGRSGGAAPVVWRAAALVGAPALALTAALGIALPTLAIPGLGFGNGPGGGGPLQLSDPTLDLQRNLTQPNNSVVMEYTTNNPQGLHLRMASLPQLDSSGFHNIAMQLTDGNRLPAIPGVNGERGQRERTTIRVFDFKSEYLPLPYAPRTFDAPGSWASDANSLVVIAGSGRNRSDAIRNLSYTVDSVDIAPSEAELRTAGTGTPADASVTAALPNDLPDDLIQLSREVIGDADTPMLKAAAIQRYLRSSRFTYDVEPLPGKGYRALENFLLVDRRGYCEQFAASMAMMARVAGIPSRVAVGFLPGKRDGNRWRVSVRDMHAWPELYFANYGWVRFEPTPANRTGDPPDWTVATSPQESQAPSEEPSADASSEPSEAPEAPSEAPTETPTTTDQPTGASWQQSVLWAGVGLAVLLILAAPATIRVRRRAGRLSGEGEASDQVESAWAEIRDTVVDYGGRWPEGSPQMIGRRIADRLDGPEAQAMGRVATLVERSRYARTVDLSEGSDGPADLPTLTEDIRRGLAEPRSRWSRFVAFVLPRSLLRRRR